MWTEAFITTIFVMCVCFFNCVGKIYSFCYTLCSQLYIHIYSFFKRRIMQQVLHVLNNLFYPWHSCLISRKKMYYSHFILCESHRFFFTTETKMSSRFSSRHISYLSVYFPTTIIIIIKKEPDILVRQKHNVARITCDKTEIPRRNNVSLSRH